MISPTLRPLPDNTQQSQQRPIPSAGFEPAIPTSERPQTHALDRAATGIGCIWKNWDGLNMRHVWGEERCVQGFGRKTWSKGSLEKPRRRCGDNIVTYFEEPVWGLDWIDLAQDREKWRAVVSMAMNSGLHKTQGTSRQYEELFVSFSRRTVLRAVSLLGNKQTTLQSGPRLQQYSQKFILTVILHWTLFLSAYLNIRWTN